MPQALRPNGGNPSFQESMMKTIFFAGALALALTFPAAAEPWVDWAPQKGVTSVTAVHVDPNHIDDYLTGLKKIWLPGEEYAKKTGQITDYEILVNVNAAGTGPNVLLVEHLPSFAVLDPNKKRDLEAQKAVEALAPKTQQDAQVAGFDKYRSFVGSDLWQAIEFTK
jgi:hypothetical protein